MNWLLLVQKISDDVIARIAAAGLPPLVDGAILIGPEHIAENASPNRIVFVPISSRYAPRDASMRQGRNAPISSEGSGVLSVLLTNGGASYTTANVLIAAPDLTGTTATATADVGSGGSIHRIRMLGMGSGYTAAPTVTLSGNGSGASAIALLGPTPEQLAAAAAKPIWTEWMLYQVHLWGCTYAGGFQATNPETDWDATATLALLIQQSLNDLAHGCVNYGKLVWKSSEPSATKLQIIGRYATLDVEIMVPVPELAYEYAPVGTVGNVTTNLLLPDGSSGQGCSD